MENVTAYSGYLKTTNENRKLHYVFVQTQSNTEKPENDPLTVWLNGGPGCSSLIGFMQQVGPYIVGSKYNDITKNPHRWNKASNMLFIESPGIVGFSTDLNSSFSYSDMQTADDAFVALTDFIWTVGSEFKNSQLFLSGESYAGKYIPDLTVRILDHNKNNLTHHINITGLLIGNGVMNFKDDSLTKSSIQYMIEHDFFSHRLHEVYEESCLPNWHSPRCQYFKYQFGLIRRFINHYNVYEVCNQKSIEDIRLIQLTRQFSQKIFNATREPQKYPNDGIINLQAIEECPSDAGMIQYLNKYKKQYHVDTAGKNWTVCANLTYRITETGSMDQYNTIFFEPKLKVWLYNGDWDDVVPYPDTDKGLKALFRQRKGNQDPWSVGEHHAGFYQMYDEKSPLSFISVKGASHMVPQTKRQASYQMFYNFIKGRPINTPVQK